MNNIITTATMFTFVKQYQNKSGLITAENVTGPCSIYNTIPDLVYSLSVPDSIAQI